MSDDEDFEDRTLTFEQREAIFDCYTTMRALYNTHGRTNPKLALTCGESANKLVEAFDFIAAFEKKLDDFPPEGGPPA